MGGENALNRFIQAAESRRDGLGYQRIAERLYISLDTVRSRIKSVYAKLHGRSQAELLRDRRNR